MQCKHAKDWGRRTEGRTGKSGGTPAWCCICNTAVTHKHTVLSVLNPQAGGFLHIFGSVPSTSCVPCTSMLATDSLLVCWLLTHSFDCSQAYSRLQQTAVSKVQPFLRGSCRHQVLHSVGVATDTFALSHQNPRSPKRSKQSFWAFWYGESCGP